MPDYPTSRRPFRAMRHDRDYLFRFVTRQNVLYATDACERVLRSPAICHEMTSGFSVD